MNNNNDDDDDIYRDEDLAGTVSQLQGRPSLRLDSWPRISTTTTTTGDTPFRFRNPNASMDLKLQQQQQQQHGCPRALATARTAPSSPARRRSRVPPPRRPLTPTPTAAPPTPCSVTVAPRCRRAMMANDDFVVEAGSSHGSNSYAPIRSNFVNPDGDMSLVPSSRWVSFSFASGLTSRRHSEGHLSSTSISPQPRAEIIPSRFPNLQFSDEEGTGCFFGSPPLLPLLSPKTMMLNDCIQSSLGHLPEGERQNSQLLVDAATVDAEDEMVILEPEGVSREGRRSVILTSVVPPSVVAEAESEGSEGRRSLGKRGRSGIRSPLPTSFLICCRGDSAARDSPLAPHGEAGEICDAEGAKRQRVDAHPPLLHDNREVSALDEEFAYSICVDTSRSMPQDGESLLLVSGPTPTPWRRRLVDPINKTPSIVAAAVADGEKEEETVADACCADTFAASFVALLDENSAVGGGVGATGSECGDECDSNNRRSNDGDFPSLASRGETHGDGATAPLEREVLREETPRGGAGASIPIVSRHPLTSTSMCHHTDDLRALIRAAREEVRHTSEQLVAVLESHRAASSGGGTRGSSNKNKTGSVDGSPKDAEISVRLSFGRSSAVMGAPEAAVGEGHGGDRSEIRGVLVSPDASVLRRELATHAGRISRRLRGYDATDAGTLPMLVVMRVVRQVLSEGVDADRTPVRDGADELDLSWCIASPLPVVQHMASGQEQTTIPSPTAACRSTWEKAMCRQNALIAEESAVQLYMGLWCCFRERFGVRHAAKRMGFLDSNNGDCPLTTLFPYMRQQLFQELGERGQQRQKQQQLPSSLDALIDYNIFAASLSELN